MSMCFERLIHATRAEAIYRELRSAILRTEYPVESRLPSEAELSSDFGVSRPTLREALRALEDEGLIFRRQGVGTFTRHRPIQKNLNENFGITEMIHAMGLRAGTAHVAIREVNSGPVTAAHLRLSSGDRVLEIERVRTADDQPLVYSLDILPKLLAESKRLNLSDLGQGSLYDLLASVGIVIHHGIAKILPVRAPKPAAGFLGVSEGIPLLYLHQVDFDGSDTPLVLSHEYYRPDLTEICILRRGPTGAFPRM